MPNLTLEEFIDKHADIIDSENTYDLLFYGNMELSDDDLSTLTKELSKLGLSLLKHLERDNDEVRLFSDDFTLNDLQKYLDENFTHQVDVNDYSKYSLSDMFELLEDQSNDLGIQFGSTNMEPFEYTDEYLAYLKISVKVDSDQNFIQALFVTENALTYKVLFDIENDAFALNSSVGYTLNKNTLKDDLVNIDKSLSKLFKTFLDDED